MVVPIGDAPGIKWVGTMDAAQHPTVPQDVKPQCQQCWEYQRLGNPGRGCWWRAWENQVCLTVVEEGLGVMASTLTRPPQGSSLLKELLSGVPAP